MRRKIILLLSIFLAMAFLNPVPSASAPVPRLVYQGGPDTEPATPASDKITSFAGLKEWLKSNRKTGGKAVLQNDLVVSREENYTFSGWLNDPMMYVDAGEHTIYVEGALELNPYITVLGEGGENGIFHVKRDGILRLYDTSGQGLLAVRSRNGYALYQEEGSILDIGTEEIHGEIRFAEKPVVWPSYNYSLTTDNINPILILPWEAQPDPSQFPETSPGYLSENGIFYYNDELELGVTWDLDRFAEELESRTRFVLTGAYTDSNVECFRGPPSLQVVFQRENHPVFLKCLSSLNEQRKILTVNLYFMANQADVDYAMEYSWDNKNWIVDEEEPDWDPQDGVGYIWQTFEYEDEGSPPRYFSISATDQNGNTVYSDTVTLDEHGGISGLDNGGGRNGETSPEEPGDTLPPINSQPENKPSHSGVIILPSTTHEVPGPEPETEPTPASEPEQDRLPQQPVSPQDNHVKSPVENPVESAAGKPETDLPKNQEANPVAEPPKAESGKQIIPTAQDPQQVSVEGETKPPKKQIALAWGILFILGVPVYVIPRLSRKNAKQQK